MNARQKAMSVGLLLLSAGGCTKMEQGSGQGPQNTPKKYSPERAEALWEQFAEAGRFSFTSPQRESTLWRDSYERAALLKIIEECPGGMDEARARLRLAGLIPLRGNRARHHVILAQRILTELMEVAPDTPELMSEIVEATRRADGWVDGETPYYQRARQFIQTHWNAGGEEAPEAGYHLARLMLWTTWTEQLPEQVAEQRRQYERVVRKYPNSYWGMAAHLMLIHLREREISSEVRGIELIQFADTCPESPLAGNALAEAATRYGGGYTMHARGESALKRLVKAVELYTRLAERFPNWPRERMEYWPQQRYRRWTQNDVPHLSVGLQTLGPDVAELERACQAYFAVNPFGNPYVISTILPQAKGIHEDEPAREAYYDAFWDAAEKAAIPEMREAVLAGRVHFRFFLGYDEDALSTAAKALDRLLREYPEGQHVPAALDAVALHHRRNKHPQEAARLWRQFLEKYPDHPLARVVAFDLAFLERSGGTDGQGERSAEADWRAALMHALQRRPDDVVTLVVAHSLCAESLSREERYAEAVAEYDKARERWPAVTPSLRDGGVEIGVNRIPLSYLDEASGRRPSWLAPPKKYTKDLELRKERKPQTPDEEILFYQEAVERYPDSPRAAGYLYGLCKLLVAKKRYGEARAGFAKYIRQYPSHAAVVLAARLWLIRLGYVQPGDPAKPLGRAEAVRQIRTALERYDKTIERIKPNDALGRDVAAIHSGKWSDPIAIQLVERGYPKLPDKWFLLQGDGRTSVELFDGEQREIVVLPTYRNALPTQGLTYLIPYLSEALGLGEESATRFVEEVVRGVFLLDDAGNLLELAMPTPYGKIWFYNEERTRLRTSRAWPPRGPSDDILPPPVFLEHVEGRWVSSEGKGWFVWATYPY